MEITNNNSITKSMSILGNDLHFWNNQSKTCVFYLFWKQNITSDYHSFRYAKDNEQKQ